MTDEISFNFELTLSHSFSAVQALFNSWQKAKSFGTHLASFIA
jgi:hypothetical protein